MWLFAFIPTVAATAGAVYTVLRPPGAKAVGVIQHFAAGVVFYAAAGELLPDATRGGSIEAIMLGGAAGIGAMLLLRHLAAKARGPAGLVAASAVDVLIDGLVLGLSFQAGQHQGVLLGIALAIELLFLGLSIATAFRQSARRLLIIAVTAAVALLLPFGALVAQPIGQLPASYQTAAFAFGLIALLYLVTEELLVEAHEKPETAWGAASFFVGFLALMVLARIIAE